MLQTEKGDSITSLSDDDAKLYAVFSANAEIIAVGNVFKEYVRTHDAARITGVLCACEDHPAVEAFHIFLFRVSFSGESQRTLDSERAMSDHTASKVVVAELILRKTIIDDGDVWVAEPAFGDVVEVPNYIRKSKYDLTWGPDGYARSPGLLAVITTMLETYEQKRSAYFAVSKHLCPTVTESDEACERVAGSLIAGVGDLASDKTVLDAVRQLSTLFEKAKGADDSDAWMGKRLRYILERVLLTLAKDSLGQAERGLERFCQLLSKIVPYRPSPRAAAFLQRVSRCYIFGFDTECAVMCRAVIDTEFEAEISVDDCIKVLGNRKPLYFPLDDRIATAVKLGRISFEAAEQARHVKTVGNEMIHRRPDVKGVNALLLIEETLAVIAELGGADPAEA